MGVQALLLSLIEAGYQNLSSLLIEIRPFPGVDDDDDDDDEYCDDNFDDGEGDDNDDDDDE